MKRLLFFLPVFFVFVCGHWVMAGKGWRLSVPMVKMGSMPAAVDTGKRLSPPEEGEEEEQEEEHDKTEREHQYAALGGLHLYGDGPVR